MKHKETGHQLKKRAGLPLKPPRTYRQQKKRCLLLKNHHLVEKHLLKKLLLEKLLPLLSPPLRKHLPLKTPLPLNLPLKKIPLLTKLLHPPSLQQKKHLQQRRL